MSYKGIGAVLIIAGCGGFGLSLAAGCRREEALLRQLIRVLQAMRWELQYRLTPLPELCRQAAGESGGVLREVFSRLSRELDAQNVPEVSACMAAVLRGMYSTWRRQPPLARNSWLRTRCLIPWTLSWISISEITP